MCARGGDGGRGGGAVAVAVRRDDGGEDMAVKGHGGQGQGRERGEARRGASVVVPSRACIRGARRGEIRIWAVVSRRGRHRAPRSREARQAGGLLLGHHHSPIAFNFWIPRAAVYTNSGRAAPGKSPGTRELQAESGRAGPGSLRRSAQTPDVPRTRP